MWTPPDVDLRAGSDAETAELMARLATLTPQQVRVLMMLSEGLLNKQIAYQLGVSEATVKAHVSAILQKLGVESRTQAVIAAAKIEAGQWPQGAPRSWSRSETGLALRAKSAVAARRVLLRRRHAQHAPLREQRAQRRRLERLVQHLDALRARLLAHRRRAVGGDQDRRQVAAEARAQRAIASMPLPLVEMVVDQQPVRRGRRFRSIAASAAARSGALSTSQPQPRSSVSMPSSTVGSLSMHSTVVPASWLGIDAAVVARRQLDRHGVRAAAP